MGHTQIAEGREVSLLGTGSAAAIWLMELDEANSLAEVPQGTKVTVVAEPRERAECILCISGHPYDIIVQVKIEDAII